MRKRSAKRISLTGAQDSRRSPKFEEYAEQFLEWSKQQHRPKTHDLHKWNCQTLKRFFAGKYLDEISTQMVEDFKSARKHEPRQGAKDARLVTDR